MDKFTFTVREGSPNNFGNPTVMLPPRETVEYDTYEAAEIAAEQYVEAIKVVVPELVDKQFSISIQKFIVINPTIS